MLRSAWFRITPNLKVRGCQKESQASSERSMRVWIAEGGTARRQASWRQMAWLAAFLSAASVEAAVPCDTIRTFADDRLPLRELFVAPSGSNTTGDGSRTKPFQTLTRALQGWRPGDAIRLLPGNYNGGLSLSNVRGTPAAPIWIGGVPGEALPVIRGGTSALQMSRVSYLVLENLSVIGATVNGVNCDDGGDYGNPDASHHLLFRNLQIQDIGTGGNHDGLKLSGINDYFVVGCAFQRMSAGGSGIDHVGCHRGLIVGCSFVDMGSNAIQCKGGSEDIEIRGNRILNGGGRAVNIGGSTGFQFFRPPLVQPGANVEARNIRVLANLFTGSDAPLAFVGAVDCIAANNTVVSPRRWVVRILQETVSSGGYTFLPSASNRVVNNLIFYDRSVISTHVNVGGNTAPATFSFENNLWYAFNQPAQSRPALPVGERNGIYGADPRFRDAPAQDYSVETNSPAAAKGLKLGFLKSDLLMACYADVPSLGAFEAVPAAPLRADTDGDLMPDDWESATGLNPNDASDADSDLDADNATAWAEYVAGTDPRDPASRFSLAALQLEGGMLSFEFATAIGRRYVIESRGLLPGSEWRHESDWAGDGLEARYVHPVRSDGLILFRVRIELAR